MSNGRRRCFLYVLVVCSARRRWASVWCAWSQRQRSCFSRAAIGSSATSVASAWRSVFYATSWSPPSLIIGSPVRSDVTALMCLSRLCLYFFVIFARKQKHWACWELTALRRPLDLRGLLHSGKGEGKEGGRGRKFSCFSVFVLICSNTALALLGRKVSF